MAAISNMLTLTLFKTDVEQKNSKWADEDIVIISCQ